MKLFKTVDEKFEDLGFHIVSENEYGVRYERYHMLGSYTQVLAITRKARGAYIIQSYDKDRFDDKKIGNICVGLTYQELCLIRRKMLKRGWANGLKELILLCMS